MNVNRLRWTPLCVTATATALLAPPGLASRTHKLKPGENLEGLAHRYHVSVHALVAANHLANADRLREGHTLHIPDPKPAKRSAEAVQKRAYLKADQVRLHTGPGATCRSVDCINAGTRFVVTARRNGWAHVTLPNGHTGWMRQDFVAYRTPDTHAKRKSSRMAAHQTSPSRSRRAQAAAAHAHRQMAQHHGKPAHLAAGRPTKQTSLRREAHWKTLWRERWRRQQMAKAHTAQHRQEAHRTPSPARTDIVRTAFAYRGTPYRYGGASRGGFDCSGFTSYLYRKRGVSLPHSARGQFHSGQPIGRAQMKPGDLVFFHTVTPGISHVGMYVGNGKFVHASSRRQGGVRVDSLDSGYYRARFRGARRFQK